MYEPLDPARHEIRLIKVLSENALSHPKEQPLECTTLTVSLNASPQYTALSYAWGITTRTNPLILNGMLTYITESLDLALRHVSSQIEGAEPSLVWADALCINQENNIEKSWQVQLMRRIYAGAVKVFAWLGVASHDSDLAIKNLS